MNSVKFFNSSSYSILGGASYKPFKNMSLGRACFYMRYINLKNGLAKVDSLYMVSRGLALCSQGGIHR